MYNGRRERSASSTFWISWTLSSMSSGWLKRQPHFVASAPRISADCDARPPGLPAVRAGRLTVEMLTFPVGNSDHRNLYGSATTPRPDMALHSW